MAKNRPGPIETMETSWLDEEIFAEATDNDAARSLLRDDRAAAGDDDNDEADDGGGDLRGRVRSLTSDAWTAVRSNLATPPRVPCIPSRGLKPVTNSASSSDGSIASQWTSFARRRRVPVLMVNFLILWPLGLYSLPRFIKSTDSTFRPDPGTPSGDAAIVFRKAYGSQDGGLDVGDPLNPGAIVILDQAGGSGGEGTITDGRSKLHNATRDFALGFEDYLRGRILEGLPPGPKKSAAEAASPSSSAPSASSSEEIPKVEVVSTYSLAKQSLTTVAKALTTTDGRTTILRIRYSVPADVESDSELERKYIANIDDSIRSYGDAKLPEGVRIYYTGLKFFQDDVLTSTRADMHKMDWYVLPLALIILPCVLDAHFAVLLIPVVTIFSTIFLWSIVMLGLGKFMQITQMTPSVMMSLTVALGIDYALFLLSRYLSEIIADAGVRDDDDAAAGGPGDGNGDEHAIWSRNVAKHRAIQSAVEHAGHTILISGVTLQCTFLGLTLLPLESTKSVGVGSAVAIGSALFVNLLLVPTMLHTSYGNLLLRKDRVCRDRVVPWAAWAYSRCRRGCKGLPRHVPCCRRGRDDRGLDELVGSSMRNLSTDQGYTSLREALLSDYDEDGRLDPSAHQGRNEPLLSQGDNDDVDDDRDRAASDGRRDEMAESEALAARVLPPASIWTCLSVHLLHSLRSIYILGFVLLLLLPVALHSTKIDSSISFEQMMPSSSSALDAAEFLGQRFGRGTLSPYHVIFDGHKTGKRVDTPEGFDVMHKVLKKLMEIDGKTDVKESLNMHEGAFDEPLIHDGLSQDGSAVLDDLIRATWGRQDAPPSSIHESFILNRQSTHRSIQAPTKLTTQSQTTAALRSSNATSYVGIATAEGVLIPHPLFVAAKLCAQIRPHCPLEVLHSYDYLDSEVTSKDRLATYVTATLGVEPFSSRGVDWLLAARDKIDGLERADELDGYRVVVEGGAGIEYDAVKRCYDHFPTMIGLTLVVVFVLVGLFFRSVVVPLRSVASLCLTLSFVYGLAVLVYQEGVLDWTGIHSLAFSGTGEVSWIAPVMAFCIIVGLGLDYDVFLTSRILEYRLLGFEHQTSVAAGLHATGGIITAAGVIMAVAFGGLMLSTTPALYQWSFLLTSAVLLDTFVVETVVVPILMGWTGKYSWWPRTLPEGRIDLLHHEGTRMNGTREEGEE